MLVSDYQTPKTRPKGRKHSLNERYFAKIGTAQAYWLGFLAADGCVSLRTRNGCLQFVLSAGSKDREQVEKLRTALGSTHRLNGPHRGVYQWIVTSYPLCLAIEKWGIVPNKSLTLQMPKLRGHLFWHWLRGLIDGDGCFNAYFRPSRAKKRNGKGRPATSGRSVMMLSVVGSVDVTTWLQARFGGGWRLQGNIGSWSINDSRAIAIIARAYAGSTPETRLARKWKNAIRLGIVKEDEDAARTLERRMVEFEQSAAFPARC